MSVNLVLAVKNMDETNHFTRSTFYLAHIYGLYTEGLG